MTEPRISSSAKGKRGERELVHFLRDAGFEAGRAQQYKGSAGSFDIDCPHLEAIANIKIECKRVEKGNIYDWLDQAKGDAGPEDIPVVMHRRSNRPWIVIMDLKHFLKLMRMLWALRLTK